MNEENIKPITDPKEIPSGMSDEEQLLYWSTHGITEEFLGKTEEVPEDERPRSRGGRTAPISLRLEPHTLDRLRTLADKRGIGYQTLLKKFVDERLYEEEKREGLLSSADQQANKRATEDLHSGPRIAARSEPTQHIHKTRSHLSLVRSDADSS